MEVEEMKKKEAAATSLQLWTAQIFGTSRFEFPLPESPGPWRQYQAHQFLLTHLVNFEMSNANASLRLH